MLRPLCRAQRSQTSLRQSLLASLVSPERYLCRKTSVRRREIHRRSNTTQFSGTEDPIKAGISAIAEAGPPVVLPLMQL